MNDLPNMNTDEQTVELSSKALESVGALTKEQAAIIGAFTGVCCGPFSDIAEYAERKLGRPIWTHEYPSIVSELQEAVKDDFVSICYEV